MAKFMTRDKIKAELSRLSRLQDEQQERLDAFVAGLGDTAEGIAQRLRRRGIKGIKGSQRKCALAVALRREFGVSDVYVSGGNDLRVDGFSVEEPSNKVAIDAFIGKFDGGRYPSLVK